MKLLRTRSFPMVVYAFVLLLVVSSSAAAGTVYVKWDSPGPQHGNSWATAYHTIQQGINDADVGNEEVWVARGTYLERIILKDGVSVYGGFAGTETERGQRDFRSNETVIDRQQSGSVVTASNVTTGAIDGFTIRNGRATSGGGIYCYYSSPAISNNTITGNSAGWGGGIYCSHSSPAISNNAITGNSACQGGGICCFYYSSPAISNNAITGNSACQGGGICCGRSSPAISNNVVVFNSSGIYGYSGAPVLRNNCVYNPDGLNYSGISPGAGDIQVDPKLCSVEYGNAHIQPDSPCIDAGYDSVVQPGWLDMDGQGRINGAHVDIGADESYGEQWQAGPYVIIRVSTSGNDANDGLSWASAKQTVQAGIDAASAAGGEVWVAAATYNECVTLRLYAYVYGGFAGTENSRDERNWVSNLTVLDGSAAGSVVTPNAGYRAGGIDGFTIRNGNAQYGGGVYCDSSSPVISNNTITGNSAYQGGGIFCAGSSAAISNNIITGNGAIYGGGIYCGWSSPTKISNNTITGNSGTGIYCDHSSPAISNNVVAFNWSGIYNFDGAPALRNNCVHNPGGYDYSGISKGAGDIPDDPLFVDKENGDYHLRFDSPCIDAGTNEGAPSTDLDGNPRPADGNGDGLAITDIGAYEYQPIPVTIDVAPGDSANIIRLRNRLILVAILSDSTFDARWIAPTSVVFGPGRAVEVHGRGHWEDVNRDGLIDLLLHFLCSESGIAPGDTSVSLSGRLNSGEAIHGSDTITVLSR
ncbi:MAG TPA: right-handed parallel beta-helix repeat-containing protein [Armatimonadota bacterium]|nr:right-handed parallel beta-helix repeat-containing protein [Armatimonadota bacterium]